MNKEEKINAIKAWLQMFGERDNETFSTDVFLNNHSWTISMQYNYDLREGFVIEPNDWCMCSSKQYSKNHIKDRTDEELDQILEHLKNKQNYW